MEPGGPVWAPTGFRSLSSPLVIHTGTWRTCWTSRIVCPNKFQIPIYRWIPNICSSFYHPFLRFISHSFLETRSTYPGCWAWAAAESDKKPGPLFSVHTGGFLDVRWFFFFFFSIEDFPYLSLPKMSSSNWWELLNQSSDAGKERDGRLLHPPPPWLEFSSCTQLWLSTHCWVRREKLLRGWNLPTFCIWAHRTAQARPAGWGSWASIFSSNPYSSHILGISVLGSGYLGF